MHQIRHLSQGLLEVGCCGTPYLTGQELLLQFTHFLSG